MCDKVTKAQVVIEIQEFNQDRKAKLVRLKYRKMAQDAFAFFRGTDHLFASHWRQLHPPDVGPAILISGDLHLENFGAYRSDEGDAFYDINDFDEALVAPCSLDVVRCATSILLAAQLWKLTPVEAMRMVLSFVDHYRGAVTDALRSGTVGELTIESARGPIRGLLRRPIQGDRTKFIEHLTERTGDGGRRIERKSGRFRGISRDRQDTIKKAVELNGQHPGPQEGLEVVDVTFRIAGIGSLGLRRYAVLVSMSHSPDPYRLYDLKAGSRPSLLACTEERQPFVGDSDARRAVRAQRQLQAKPTAALQVLTIDDQDYRLRELIPEENRTGLQEFRRRSRRLRRAVAIAGQLTGWAHVRGSRLEGDDRSVALGRWVAGSGLESVIASAVRFADQTRRDYKAFSSAVP